MNLRLTFISIAFAFVVLVICALCWAVPSVSLDGFGLENRCHPVDAGPLPRVGAMLQDQETESLARLGYLAEDSVPDVRSVLNSDLVRRGVAVNDEASNPIDSRSTAIPGELVDLARSLRWHSGVIPLFRSFFEATYDRDGDGVLHDLERISGIRAIRSVVWPEVDLFVDDLLCREELEWDGSGAHVRSRLAFSDAMWVELTAGESLLLEDLREERRSWFSDHGFEFLDPGTRSFLEDQEGEVFERFDLADDGRLSGREAGQFFAAWSRGTNAADVNGDRVVDTQDIHAFLFIVDDVGY